MADTRRIDWLDIIIGVLLILGGIFVLGNILAAYFTVARLLGFIFIIRGIFLIITSIKIRQATHLQANGVVGIIGGIIGIVLGIYLAANPGISLVTLGYLVAIWLILEAIENIFRASRFRSYSTGLWVLQIILNVLMLIAGIFLMFNWALAGLTGTMLMGLALIFNGIFAITSGIMQR